MWGQDGWILAKFFSFANLWTETESRLWILTRSSFFGICIWFDWKERNNKQSEIEYHEKNWNKTLTNFAGSWRQVHFAGRRLQVAGWNLIITGKLLTLRIINKLYTRQRFLHKVVRVFHLVKTRSIRYKYLSIDTLIAWHQWNLFKAIWITAG